MMTRSFKGLQPASPMDVRIWAREKGLKIGTRGVIAADIFRQFTEETGRTVGVVKRERAEER